MTFNHETPSQLTSFSPRSSPDREHPAGADGGPWPKGGESLHASVFERVVFGDLPFNIGWSTCPLCAVRLKPTEAAHKCPHGMECRLAHNRDGSISWRVALCVLCDDDDTGPGGWRGTCRARPGQ